MAKGLSDTQKTILKVIRDFPESIDNNHHTGGLNNYLGTIHNKLKAVLYPKLYYDKTGYGCTTKNYGCNKNEKNSARVTISKSITRLVKRGLLEFKNPEGHPGTWRIYLTNSGKLLVNEVPKQYLINQ